MRIDVKRELISTEVDRVLDALIEAEKVRRKIFENSGMSKVIIGVDLRQIQMELFNEDNSIPMTDLSDTIVRDRLNRLESSALISSKKMGREKIYMSPRTVRELEEQAQQRDQDRQDRAKRLSELSSDLGYPIEWVSNSSYRNRENKVVILVDDLEAIARHIDAVEDQ